MYELVANDKVLMELNNGAELFIMDVPTLRAMKCDDMTLQAIKGFIDKPEAVFLKRVVND